MIFSFLGEASQDTILEFLLVSVNVVWKEAFLGCSLFRCPGPRVETLTPMVFVTPGKLGNWDCFGGLGATCRIVRFVNEAAVFKGLLHSDITGQRLKLISNPAWSGNISELPFGI